MLYFCLFCSFLTIICLIDRDYEGWPEDEEKDIPLKFMTEEHRQIIIEKCSDEGSRAILPNLPYSELDTMEFMEFGDDDSFLSDVSEDAKEKDDDAPPREDWSIIQGETRSSLLKSICDSSTEDLTVVQVSLSIKSFLYSSCVKS